MRFENREIIINRKWNQLMEMRVLEWRIDDIKNKSIYNAL